MLLTEEQLKVKALLAETVTLLCRDGLRFKSEVRIEGLIGITIDHEQVVLVNINEAIMLPSSSEHRFRSSRGGHKVANSAVTQKGLKTVKNRRRKIGSQQSDVVYKDQVMMSDETAADEVAEYSENGGESVASCVKTKRLDNLTEQHLSMTVEDALLGELVSCRTVKVEPDSAEKTFENNDADDEINIAGCSNWSNEETGDTGGGDGSSGSGAFAVMVSSVYLVMFC